MSTATTPAPTPAPASPRPTSTRSTSPARACAHEPVCPPAHAPDHEAAAVLSRHPEQGWSLLCNGVVVFDDTGELLPDGRVVAPHRPMCRVWSAA